jgi:adenine phosphoribosyltransferase
VHPLRQFIRDVPDFPQSGILFRDIAPLLRNHLADTIEALAALLDRDTWRGIDAVAGIESRGFILASALAVNLGKGFVPIRKKGKLPPPVVDIEYSLEYGSGVLEMQRGSGVLALIDDVVATGGTMRASAELCPRAGYEVRALLALADLRLSGERLQWRGLPLRSVIDYT